MLALILSLALAQPAPGYLSLLGGAPVRLCQTGPALPPGRIAAGVPYAPMCGGASSLLKDLVAYYNFDNQANDSLGSYNGTAVGAWGGPPPFYVTGFIGSGAFSMSPGAVPITFNQGWWLSNVAIPQIPLGVEWTVAGWVNFAGPAQTPDFVISYITGGSEGLRANIGSAPYYTKQGGTYNAVTVLASGWHHIGATYSASDTKTLRLYVDGALDAVHVNVALGGGFTAWTPNQFFGSNFDRTGRSAIGDEWGFWSRALTAAEVLQLYNGGAGITYPF